MITLELDTVDLAQIAASGQCFRMAPLEDGRWLVPMGRWMATARQRDARRIELSADGPMKPPYAVYFQGGLTWPHAKLGILQSLQQMDQAGLVKL